MGLTLSQPIATASQILSDEGNVTHSAANLLRYANDALDAILGAAPRWFHTRATHACTAGEADQSLSFADAHALVAVERIVGGDVVRQVDKRTLDAFRPGWASETAGPAVNWMVSDASLVDFSIYPKAPVAQSLEVVYVRVPAEYTDSADTGLPATLGPAITDYIVGMAMAEDDEHVNAGRSAQFLQSFAARVGGAA